MLGKWANREIGNAGRTHYLSSSEIRFALICGSMAGAILIALGVAWLRPVFLSPPHVWASRLCLKEGQRPGTRRFWRRFRWSMVFVIQQNDSQRRGRCVTVLAPTYGEERLRAMAQGKHSCWRRVPGVNETFEVDPHAYARRYKVDAGELHIRAEIQPGLGVMFVSERVELLTARLTS